MRVNPSVIFRALLVVGLLIFAFYIWPTPYREYAPPGQFREWVMKVRVNRITGAQDFLVFGEGWKRAHPRIVPEDTTGDAMDSALSQIRKGQRK